MVSSLQTGLQLLIWLRFSVSIFQSLKFACWTQVLEQASCRRRLLTSWWSLTMRVGFILLVMKRMRMSYLFWRLILSFFILSMELNIL